MTTPDYYDSLTLDQRNHYDRQELFLSAYEQLGMISKAAHAVNVPVATVEGWQHKDTHGFNKRLEAARQIYVESWEEEMDRRLADPKGNRGSDVLLMFKLKAEKPEKYREEVKVVGIEASKQMMDRLRELAARDRKALDSSSVEGESRQVDE
jgi:hypothetical protein